MMTKENLNKIGEVLWDFLTDEVPDPAEAPGEVELLTESLGALAEAGVGVDGVTAEDLQMAIEQLAESMTVQQQAQLAPLREAIANQPEPVVQQIIQQAGDEVTVVRNVTEVTEVTNVTNIDEGDQFVDQSVNTTILAEGDVDFDQNIENTANVGDDGAVVVGGDLEDSAVNTGQFEGVQGGGDVSIEDSAIGDGNVLANDAEIDAFAIGGNATDVDAGGNANVGSGTQIGIEAEGDVDSIVGSDNDLTGDQTANIGTAPAPPEEPPAFEDNAIEEQIELEAQALEDSADLDDFELDG